MDQVRYPFVTVGLQCSFHCKIRICVGGSIFEGFFSAYARSICSGYINFFDIFCGICKDSDDIRLNFSNTTGNCKDFFLAAFADGVFEEALGHSMDGRL